jgi:serine/threonine protein kinase
VAKALASDTTHPGAVLGTLRYMAPEQLENAAATKANADIYALGAILYECLTGVRVHHGETVEEIMFDILHRAPKPPSEFRALPDALERIILCALARDPEKRFANMKALEAALAQFGPAPVVPTVAPGFDEETLSDGEALVSSARARRSRSFPAPNTPIVVALVAASAMGGWLSRGSAQAFVPVVERVPTRAVTSVTSATTPAASARHGELAPRLSRIDEAVEPKPVAPARVRSASLPRGSLRSRARASAAATGSSQPIAGRFDPTDPYE